MRASSLWKLRVCLSASGGCCASADPLSPHASLRLSLYAERPPTHRNAVDDDSDKGRRADGEVGEEVGQRHVEVQEAEDLAERP